MHLVVWDSVVAMWMAVLPSATARKRTVAKAKVPLGKVPSAPAAKSTTPAALWMRS
jgi:predicted secreted protein